MTGAERLTAALDAEQTEALAALMYAQYRQGCYDTLMQVAAQMNLFDEDFFERWVRLRDRIAAMLRYASTAASDARNATRRVV